MNSLVALSTMIAIAADSRYGLESQRNRLSLRPEDIDMTPPKRVIPKGCKVFLIGGQEIIALNEKSAIKKYNRKFGDPIF